MSSLDPTPWGSESLNPYEYEETVKSTMNLVDRLLGSRPAIQPTVLASDINDALDNLRFEVLRKRKAAHSPMASDRCRASLLAECCGIENAIQSIERHLELTRGAE